MVLNFSPLKFNKLSIQKNYSKNPKAWYQISGITNDNVQSPKVVWDIQTPVSVISDKIGVKTIQELHKGNILIDFLIIVFAFALFGLLWFSLATINNIFIWIPLAFLQGLVISNLFFNLRHDIFTHRQVGGSKLSFLFGVMLSLPQMNTYTRFLRHEDHHKHVGYDLIEEHQAELDKPWKRLLCLTYIGLILLVTGKLRDKNAPQANKGWEEPYVSKRARKKESIFHLFWILIIAVAFLYWPHGVLTGYLLPFIIFTPVVYSLKFALQHSETDVTNPFHASVFIRTNFIVRILFYFSLGDLHIIHHFFPRLPSWKLPKAARMMNGIILSHNVPKRTIREVLVGYYLKGHPYRELWKDRM